MLLRLFPWLQSLRLFPWLQSLRLFQFLRSHKSSTSCPNNNFVVETDVTKRYGKAAVPDRAMAWIVVISSVNDIPDAHSIQVATVGGWEVVIKKHEFIAGDEAIFWSLDSVLDPLNSHTAHLEGKRLKTVRLRKQLSQGFLGSKEWLRDYGEDPSLFHEGDDVTTQMRVRKFVSAGDMTDDDETSRRAKMNRFPEHWVPKTDETRIQNRTSLASKIVGKPVVISVKEEGTSTTALYHSFKGTTMLCGRTRILYSRRHHQSWLTTYMLDIASTFVNCYYNVLSMLRDDARRIVNYSGNYCVDRKSHEHYFSMYELFALEQQMLKLGRDIAIQFETAGPKINGNRMNRSDVGMRVFKAFDIKQRYYLSYDELVTLCNDLNLPSLRIYFRGIMPERIDELIFMSTPPHLPKKFKTLDRWRAFYAAKFQNVLVTTKSLLDYVSIFDYDEGFPSEGAVIFLDTGKDEPRTSFKVVSNRFLEKHVKDEDKQEELAALEEVNH